MKILERSPIDPASEEDYPLTAVPFTARKPIWSLAPLLMGFTLTSTTLLAGGEISSSFTFFPDMVLLVVVSNLMLGLYCATLGYIAYRSGLTTVLMARFSFGNWGSRWVDFLLGFTQIGGYAVTTVFAAQIFRQLLGLPPQYNGWLMLGFTYGFCITAYLGYQGMDWLSRLAVPVMVLMICLTVVRTTQEIGSLSALNRIEPTGHLEIGAALTIIVATFISGGTQATNWSRFANSGQNAILSTLLAFTGINGILVFVGAFCTLVYGNEDIVSAMAQQGLRSAGLLLLILNVWTTQDNTIYAFSVAGANMFRTSRRHFLVLGGATLSLGFALGGIYDNLVSYLLILGAIIPPIGGIIMADFWVRFRGNFPDVETEENRFNWAGIGAYLGASIVALWSSQESWGIAPINGVITAGLLYCVFFKITSLK